MEGLKVESILVITECYNMWKFRVLPEKMGVVALHAKSRI